MKVEVMRDADVSVEKMVAAGWLEEEARLELDSEFVVVDTDVSGYWVVDIVEPCDEERCEYLVDRVVERDGDWYYLSALVDVYKTNGDGRPEKRVLNPPAWIKVSRCVFI